MDDEKKENKAEIDGKNDEKYYDSDSDDNHEVLVNDTDLRRPIHELSNTTFQNSSFVKCIGQLYIEYNYPKQNYKLSMSGTGTVIRTKLKNGYFSSATAFVLTAAHNSRRNVWQCCGQYFEKVVKRLKMKNCSKCKKLLIKKNDSIMVKATSIQFQRRVTNVSGFGNFEEGYKCKIEYLDEYNYKAFPYPKSGFDWALLSFIDDGNYYWNNCKKIELVAVDTTKTSKYNQFIIIGYPGEKPKQMWGYKMDQNAVTMQYETSKKTNNIYLKHKEIDASSGQSGAAIATQIKDKTIIWGIHVGGNDKNKYNKYNIGTLLNKDIIEHINCIINGTQKWVNDEKWNDKTSYFGFVKNRKCHGYGKLVWKDGSCYEGSFKNGKKHGYGKYVWKSGAYYEGLYEHGKQHGYGKYVYKRGDIYEGNFVNGKGSGYGKYTWKSGKVYEGNFQNDESNGHGKITFFNGRTYEGEWKDDKYHGNGKEMDKNGNIIFEGQYKNDKRCT